MAASKVCPLLTAAAVMKFSCEEAGLPAFIECLEEQCAWYRCGSMSSGMCALRSGYVI